MRKRADAPIYLDYQATTPVDPRVAEVVVRYMTDAFGNAGSVDHIYGDEADDAVRSARAEVRALLSAATHQIVFTSGATESINLAINGLGATPRAASRLRFLTPATEHSAVLDCCAAAARAGWLETRFLPVDARGAIDLNELEDLLGESDVVSLMGANNEVGTMYPVETVGNLCLSADKRFFCDGTQLVGKEAINCENIPLIAYSAHKIYGPKGVGVLAVGSGIKLQPQVFGGGQQRGLRSGTLNVPGIAGLGEASRLRRLEMRRDEARTRELRDEMLILLRHQLPDLVLNGDPLNRLAGNLHISVPGVPNGAVIARLRNKLAISTGAACSSGTDAPSHVLRALGLPTAIQESAFRISLGKFTSKAEMHRASGLFIDAVKAVQSALDSHNLYSESRRVDLSGESSSPVRLKF